MPDTDALLSTFEWFAGALTEPYGISDILHALVEQIAVVVGVTGAGVLLLQQGRYVYVTSSLAPIAALERVVEERQIGPCVDAGNGGIAVGVEDVGTDEYRARFPEYVDQARDSRIRAVAAVPMVAVGRSIGALGLYDEKPRRWSPDDLRVAEVLANVASSCVVHAAELDDQRRITEQLQRALDSRIVIEQAKGIVAVQRGISVDEAFVLLRKRSRDNNTRLHDVCTEVVTGQPG